MKKSLLTLVLLAAPVAFGARTDSTTMDLETVSSDMHHDTNSNDRFDNRDTRTNSHSTPAYMGADQSRLGVDVTSNKYIEPNNSVVVNPDTSSARMSGTTVQDTTADTSRMSGSSTNTDAIETSPTNTSASDKTGYSTQNNRMSGTTSEPSPNDTGAAAATGAAAGTAAGASMHEKAKDEPATTSETSTTHTKKMKKTHKTHKSGSSSDVENTPVVSPRSGTSTTSKATNTESTSAATANQPSDLTAQDTSRNKRETQLVQKIRSEITDNKDLSVNAHNVKIISQNGQIYLKGPVADANEKMKLEEIAKRIAGNTLVINQTTIDSRSGSSTHK